MTRKQSKSLLHRLVSQLDNALRRIQQFEIENLLGVEHTALRKQINSLCQTIEWMQEELPCPLLPIDFQEYQVVKLKYRFGWLGYL